MIRAWQIALVGGAAAVLAGCVGPNFAPPVPVTADSRSFLDTGKPAAAPVKVLDGASSAPVEVHWWHAFHDAELSKLEGRVADENLDVQTATLRLAESRAQRAATASALLPTVGANASDYREQFSQNSLFKLIPIQSLTSSSNTTQYNGGQQITSGFNNYTVGFDASWEVDLWGHVARQVEAADAQLLANAEMRRDTLVSSLAELARDYVNLRGTQAQIKIALDNLKVEQEILNVTRVRMEKGLVTGLDVESAAAQVESVKAQVPPLQAQVVQSINAISLLLDEPPLGLSAELIGPRAIPPNPAARARRPALRAGAAPARHPYGGSAAARRHCQRRRRCGGILPERQHQREPDPAGTGAARHLQGDVAAVHEHRAERDLADLPGRQAQGEPGDAGEIAAGGRGRLP